MPPRLFFHSSRALVVLVVILIAGLADFSYTREAQAQQYIEPPTPLGGTTAAPLNTSSSTQRKAGSLIVGSSSETSRFCLNTDVVATNDFNLCIASWGELGNLTANYVKVNQDAWSGGNPQTGAQIGYARVQASSNVANQQLYTVIAEAPNLSNSAAVYATDSGNANSWAGYFVGRVYIGPSAASPADKELCLNGVDPDISSGGSDPTVGLGCIDNWGDVAASIAGGYVQLQASPGPLNVQIGGASLTGAGVFGNDPAPISPARTGGIVLGVPASGAPLCHTCGDGICNSPTETAANCPSTGQPSGCSNVPRGDC